MFLIALICRLKHKCFICINFACIAKVCLILSGYGFCNGQRIQISKSSPSNARRAVFDWLLIQPSLVTKVKSISLFFRLVASLNSMSALSRCRFLETAREDQDSSPFLFTAIPFCPVKLRLLLVLDIYLYFQLNSILIVIFPRLNQIRNGKIRFTRSMFQKKTREGKNGVW